jgi:hypothetical protein
MLDVAFDGADEVDAELNCIKGGGACLFQEKLVAERAKKFVCVADYRKRQERLLTNWPTIPIEVAPLSQLPSTHRIVIIVPAPTSYWPIASLRAAVVPGWESKVYHKLEQKNFFASGSKNVLVRQKVLKLEPSSVALDGEFEGSNVVPFDVGRETFLLYVSRLLILISSSRSLQALVIATGASQPFPMRTKREWSAEQVEQRFKEMQREIAGSQNIVVLGGGPTGIEFTGVSDDCFLVGCVGESRG